MTAHPLALVTAIAFSLITPASDAEAQETSRKATLPGDLTSQWFHVGGGFGGATKQGQETPTPAARFDLGGGFYTFLLYSSGSVNITAGPDDPFALSGVASVGVALPVPVVHPMLGIKGGGGFHTDTDDIGPQLVIGPQVGFIVRKFDGRPGLRFMFDAEVTYRPESRELTTGGFFTVAGVF